MRLLRFSAFLLFFAVAHSAIADRRILELVQLSGRGQAIPACGQDTALAVSWADDEVEVAPAANGSDNMYLFIGVRSLSPSMPQSCYDTPLLPSCLTYFPGMIQMPNKRLLRFLANSYPGLRVFVGAITTGHPTDNIAYSKAINLDFTSCPDTTPTPVLAPGNGIPVVSMSPRGPASNPLQSRKPVAKWIYGPYGNIGGAGAPTEFTVALTAYEPNIEKVIFTVTTPTGQTGSVEVLGTQTRIDKRSGSRAFVARLRSVDIPDGYTNVGAIVIPLVGVPVAMNAPITSMAQRRSDEFGLSIYNNLSGQLVPRTFHVRVNGSASSTCGTDTTPCNSVHSAFVSFRNQFGPAPGVGGATDVSGLTIQFGPGEFQNIGVTGEFWPGWQNLRGPTIFRGTKNAIGKILTTLRSRTDLGSLGYPGRSFVGMSWQRWEDLNLKSDPTSPFARDYIIGPGSDGPETSVELNNVHFEGLGLLGGGNCQGQSDGVRLTLATVMNSTFAKFLGNGNQLKQILTYISTSSIGFSDFGMILKSGAEIDHLGRKPAVLDPAGNWVMQGCVFATTPHGDVAKLAPGKGYIDGLTTPVDIAINSQGYYPTEADNVARNVLVKIGPAGIDAPESIGASLRLLAAGGNTILDRVELKGGPRYAFGASASAPVYVVNSFQTTPLPAGDDMYTGLTFPLPPPTAPQQWISPNTGIYYYVGSGNPINPAPPTAASLNGASKMKKAPRICSAKQLRRAKHGKAKGCVRAKRVKLQSFLVP